MWARVTAGQCEHAVCCRATTTRENTVAMTRERIEDDGEGWAMKEGQFAAEEKRVYTCAKRGEGRNNRWVSCLQFFSSESNKQWNYTVQPIAMESGQAWDRSTPTYMCSSSFLMPFFMFFLLHFPLHIYAVHIKGQRLNELSTLAPTEYILVWDARKAQIAFLAPRELPLGSLLDVWLPMGGTARLWNHSAF